MAEQLIARLEADGLHWTSMEPAWVRDHPDGSFDSQALADRIGSGACLTLALPGEDVLLRRLETSAAERRYLKDSLPYMLEEELAGDVEKLHFVHATVDENTTAVALISLDLIGDSLQRCQHYATPPEVMLPDSLLLPLHEQGLTIVIETSRAIVRTGPLSGFAVETTLLTTMLELYCSEQNESTIEVRLFSRDEAAALQLLPEELRARTSWESGDFLSATRMADASPDQSLNLQQGRFKPMLPWAEWWQSWRLVAGLALTAIILQLAGTLFDISELKRENQALRQSMETRYRQVNPAGAVVDPEKQLTAQLAALSGSAAGPGFVAVMQQLGMALTGQSDIQLESINFSDRNGDLRVNLRAANYESVDRLRGTLEQDGLEAVLQNSSAQGSGVRARLLVKGAGNG